MSSSPSDTAVDALTPKGTGHAGSFSTAVQQHSPSSNHLRRILRSSFEKQSNFLLGDANTSRRAH